MVNVDTCQWKMVDSDKFVLGQDADRCGSTAIIKILRPRRKNDLFLCECHFNDFISKWGVHNQVEFLCHNWMEGTEPRDHWSNHRDPGC